MKDIHVINHINQHYDPIVEAVQRQWNGRNGAVVFRVPDIGDELNDLYTANLPTQDLGPGECKTCAEFIRTYGALVYHDRKGVSHSALWNPEHAEPRYKKLFEVMRDFVLEKWQAGAINSEILPFTADYHRAGNVELNGFHHLFLDFGQKSDYDSGKLRHAQEQNISFLGWFLSAVGRNRRLKALVEYVRTCNELNDDHSFVMALTNMTEVMANWKGKQKYELEDINEYLEQSLYFARGNAHLVKDTTKQLRGGSAEIFFSDVSDPDTIAEHLVTEYLRRTAPENYKKITRRFSERELRVAEEKLRKDGLDTVLERRWVRKDDVLPFVWSSQAKEKTKLTLLAGLKVKGEGEEHPKEHLTKQISWTTFVEKYAPEIKEMYLVPPSKGNYTALTTAANPEAKNIFLWDNPMSAWVYVEGSHPTNWGLRLGELVRISGIMRSPEHEQSWSPFFDQRHLIVLDEGHHMGPGVNGLFKVFFDKTRFDYDNLANVLAATVETQFLEMDEESVVAYSVTNKQPVVTIMAEFNKSWTRFEIRTWE